MCQIAGVPCEVISGYGRGVRLPHRPGRERPAVQSRLERRQDPGALVSPGRLLGTPATSRGGAITSSTAHPTCSPNRGTSCTPTFPRTAKWQLLDRPLSAEEFAALPLLEGRFFESGLRLSTPLRRLQPVGESVQFSLAAPEDVLLMASLVEPGKGGGRQAERANARPPRPQRDQCPRDLSRRRTLGRQTVHEIAAGPGRVLAGGHAGVRIGQPARPGLSPKPIAP